jgi:hypothetical protein
MINWIEVDSTINYKEFIPYYTDEVVAINNENDILIGYLTPASKSGLNCEYSNVMLKDIKYYAPVEELLNSVRLD